MDTPWFEPVALSDPTNASSPPLPNNWGKELILKYATGLATNATWHTDSNGKEMVRRVRDERGPSYPHPYNISEPVAGNYSGSVSRLERFYVPVCGSGVRLSVRGSSVRERVF